jgi:hypothetical protein
MEANGSASKTTMFSLPVMMDGAAEAPIVALSRTLNMCHLLMFHVSLWFSSMCSKSERQVPGIYARSSRLLQKK